MGKNIKEVASRKSSLAGDGGAIRNIGERLENMETNIENIMDSNIE